MFFEAVMGRIYGRYWTKNQEMTKMDLKLSGDGDPLEQLFRNINAEAGSFYGETFPPQAEDDRPSGHIPFEK